MSFRRSMNIACFATLAGALAGIASTLPCLAHAQTSFLAPDGRNRFPGVTIFCPSGTGVAPCSFGGGLGAGGAVSINLGNTSVSAANRLPVSDPALDALIGGGALNVGGTVAVNSLPPIPLAAGTNTIGAVTQTGSWMVGLAAGTNAIGSVSIGNFPATQAVSGSVSIAAMPSLPAGGNAIGSVSVSNLPAMQTVSGAVAIAGTANVAGSVGVTSLPPLPAGANTIGAVTIAGTPNFTCSGCGGGGGGTVAQGPGSSANGWWMQGLGAAGTPSGGVVTVQGASGGMPMAVSGAFWQAVQPVSGTVAIASLPAGNNAIGSVSVSNLQATQAISASALPLPTGAALDSSVQAVKTALGAPMQQAGGTVSVTNLPATQAVSVASLPLPSGAATSAAQIAALAPVAPAAATAAGSLLVGCQASTALPAFAAGQQGAVPCDTSGRLYVVTVPSANNVPSYLQAVTSGGASIYRAINAAASTMAASVKSSAGMVYGYEACNSGAAAAYLRLFALGTSPVVGASVPQVSKLLPGGACQTMTTSIGLVFAGGIAVDVTSGSLADTDTAAVATANQIAVSVYYK